MDFALGSWLANFLLDAFHDKKKPLPFSFWRGTRKVGLQYRAPVGIEKVRQQWRGLSPKIYIIVKRLTNVAALTKCFGNLLCFMMFCGGNKSWSSREIMPLDHNGLPNPVIELVAWKGKIDTFETIPTPTVKSTLDHRELVSCTWVETLTQKGLLFANPFCLIHTLSISWLIREDVLN